MENEGWFPVWRSIFKSDIWDNEKVFRVWIYILGNVTHTPTKLSERYQCVSLEPGQMVTGRKRLAQGCALTEKEVRTALTYLKRSGRVAIKTANRFSIITVVNWQTYRDAMMGKGQQNGQQNGQHRASTGPAEGHIQKDKQLKSQKRSSAAAPAGEDGPPRAAASETHDPTPGRGNGGGGSITPFEEYKKAKAGKGNKCSARGCNKRGTISRHIGGERFCGEHYQNEI